MPELAKLCNFGQSTLYRYMRGDFNISAENEETLCRVLKLSDEEKREFHAAIEEAALQKPMHGAHQILDALVFDDIDPAGNDLTNEEILFIGKDRFLLTMEKLYQRILINADKPDFSCCLRIVKSNDEPYFHTLVDFMKRLLRHIPNAKIEHLISYPAKDYKRRVQTFIEILPLLQYENYEVYYTEDENNCDAKEVFGRSFYVSTSYDGNGQAKNENFFISMRKSSRNACICSSDPVWHEFIVEEFLDLRKQYKNDIQEFCTYNLSLDFIINMERSHPVSCINPDIHLSHLPTEVLTGKFAALNKKDRKTAADNISPEPVPDKAVDKVLDAIVSTLKMRCDSSHKQPQTAICSKSGLIEFVKTGRRCDHIKWLPAYSKDELRLIIENIRDRNEDESDAFNFYVTDKPILENRYIIYVYKDAGIAIQYNQEKERSKTNNYLFLGCEVLAGVFYEYMNSYIPAAHTVSKQETTDFLNSLLDKYLK